MPEASSRDQVAIQTIRAWAGETIFKRGQDYQLRGRVRELAATSSGGLVAWVQGNARYATSVTVNATVIPGWPLPDTSLPRTERRYPLQFPQLSVLSVLAASEGRPDEVLCWYDRRGPGRLSGINDDMVADAVVQAYPERAAKIWQQLAEAHIAQTNPAAYQEAALFLRKLRRVWARQGKQATWRDYLAALRAASRRKRRLVETLDALMREAE